MITLSPATARHLILHLQGLTRPHHKAFSSGELAAQILQLGFVQLDSICWMERAHHMILAARSQGYRPVDLDRLHVSGHLFENWTHDASLIPSEFWKYWKHKFAREGDVLHEKFTRWQGSGFEAQLQGLRDLVGKEGAVRSRDLEKPAGQKLDMWQWHDGKAALEFLWRTGEFSIKRREGFQKVYDISERVIPQADFQAFCTHEEFVDWACRSALDRLGFGTPKDIASYWDLLKLEEVKHWLAERGRQETSRVRIENCDDGKSREFFGRPDLKILLGVLNKLPDRLRILSPFDPVIRDRKRLRWLFGFDYTIEIYVPAEKRKYGYYVFPVLERDRLIGRIDCQAQRPKDVLHVKRLWLEPGIRWSKTRQEKLQAELVRQSRLCGVWEIQFGPDWLYLPN